MASRIPTTPRTTTPDNQTTLASRAADAKAAEIRAALEAARETIGALLGGKRPADAPQVDAFIGAALAHYDRQRNRNERERALFEGIDASAYVRACIDAASFRLVPNGRMGWIGFDDAGGVAWCFGWRGLVELMRREVVAAGGKVIHFHAEVVYRQEVEAGRFDVDLATRRMVHRPWYSAPDFCGVPVDEHGDPIEPMWGSVVLVYAACTIRDRDGFEVTEWCELTKSALNLRSRRSGNPETALPSEAWIVWPIPTSKAAAVRQLMDRLPSAAPVIAMLDDRRASELPPTPPTSIVERVRAAVPIEATAREIDAPQLAAGDATATRVHAAATVEGLAQ